MHISDLYHNQRKSEFTKKPESLLFRTSKTVILVISGVLVLVNSAGSYGIIYFERFGSDSKRIFANKMVSAIGWAAIFW
jgi:hypothetical protein